MTQKQIRSYFDKLNVATGRDDDGDLVVILHKDEDFGHDVTVWISVFNDSRLAFIAAASDYRPEGDLYYLVNRSNSRRNFPTAVVRGQEIRLEYSFLITEEVSDEYMVNIIRTTMSSMWTAYCDMEKENL